MRTLICVLLFGVASQGLAQTVQSRDKGEAARIHIYAGFGVSASRATSNLIAFLRGVGYYVSQSSDLFDSYRSYRQGTGMTAMVEYSVSERARIGISLSTLGALVGAEAYAGGYQYLNVPSFTNVNTVIRTATFGYYVQGSYLIIGRPGERGVHLFGGIGLGNNHIRAEYGSQTGWASSDELRDIPTYLQIEKTAFGTAIFGNLEFWTSRTVSAGFFAVYRYIPEQTLGAMTVEAGTYTDYGTNPPTVRHATVQLPEARISFSNVLYGIVFGVHF